ncbi:hypothetical protein [Clostridium brassicae]|uniref:Uncharacterized protein n=1 Tax=Clostridium brassicae TaxID=2999072 RepID=A0ABT4D5Z2_9CLOT|nr:hypothetical protein [Clostridium brassicae]MCY6957707.1 hypothetical protein [Clostridium brassicae]
MKIDFNNSLYIFLCISFFIVTLSYIKFSINKLKNEIVSENINESQIAKVSQFLNKLIIEDYVSYEKYDVWRFCVESRFVKVVV